MSENARKLDALITETRFDELKTKLAAAEARVKDVHNAGYNQAMNDLSRRTLEAEARVKELEGMLALSPETRGDIGALANKAAAGLLLEENAKLREALESLNFWCCTACEENQAIRDKALGFTSQVSKDEK